MNQDYLPKDETGLVEWFQNWSLKFSHHGTNLGFSELEIKRVQDDAIIVQNVVTGTVNVQTNRNEYTNFKRIILYGKKDSPTPEYPIFTNPALPTGLSIGLASGIIDRTRTFVKRLKLSPNYNESVGADFRVIPSKSQSIATSEAKPSIKGRALANSIIDIDFVRNEFDGIEVEMQRGNVNEWTSIGRFYKSPAEDNVPPITPNSAENRRYRARFLKGNKPIGLYSDIISVSTAP